MSGISIHASAREATNRRIDFICILRFQSTPPRGRRPQKTGIFVDRQQISIHASAREATRDCQPFHRYSTAFQSTPPRGRRPYSITSFFPHAGFQSTPPRGRRPRTGNRIVNGMLFQSTPPRGRRQNIHLSDREQSDISIHASAREATPSRGSA